MEWHSQTGKLLTCSSDRGLIVWDYSKSQDKKELFPQLGFIEESKANIHATWNLRGDKFCIGAASGNVPIGTFIEEEGFWAANPLLAKKKPVHKDSVLSVAFDPLSGRVVASGSADGYCNITTCFNKKLDTDGSGPFANVDTSGVPLLQFKSNGWINCNAFSPSGNTLVYLTHDCEINFVDVSKGADGKKEKPDKIVLRTNPMIRGVFTNEDTFIGVGFDKAPFTYKK